MTLDNIFRLKRGKPSDNVAPEEEEEVIAPRWDDSREHWINAGRLNRMLVVAIDHARRNRIVKLLLRERTMVSSIGKFHFKVGAFTTVAEAHNVLFVGKNTTVPVPKVYCAFRRKGTTYLVFGKIRGYDARWGWAERSDESKQRILEQLRGMVDQIHNIKRPEGETGVSNAVGGPFYDPRLQGDPYWGPFPAVQDFNIALLNGCDPYKASDPTIIGVDADTILPMVAWFREQSDELVFSHGDLSSLNIMVDGDEITGIVDWEMSAWLPPYWDYVNAWHANIRNLWWQNEINKFMMPRSHDLAMDKVRRQYFGWV